MNIFDSIRQAFAQCIAAYAPENSIPQIELITLNVDPNRQSFGDLSSHAPLMLAGIKKLAPRIIAQELINHFTHPLVEKCEIAGPGFINIFLKKEAFQEIVRELHLKKDAFFVLQPDEQKHRYSIEFVSANPTGPLHIGHGRNGIIGDVLARVARFLGHTATSEFYINDAGNQIAILARSLRARCEQELGIPAELPEEGYQGAYLVDIARRCIQENGPEVTNQSDDFFATYAKTQLLEQQKMTLSAYRIHFDVWFSELTLHASGAIEKSLERLRDVGYLYEKDGALWFKASELGDEKDRAVKRSSGEYTYVAADIAYLENKLERGFNRLVIVVGQDHHGYVARLKAVLQALGHDPEQLFVLVYQLVTLKNEGELLRLSKRAGRIINLNDIIETVGVDVARFFFLNRKADAHLDFDLSVACKHTEENPVFYLQYAYVRTISILEKAHKMPECQSITEADAIHLTEAEHLIIKKIVSLSSTLRYLVQAYQTHTLAYYVLELAHLFHSYYGAHRVIDPEQIPQTRARLLMIMQLQNTLRISLELLGLGTPDRM